jgi:hypothetical protein
MSTRRGRTVWLGWLQQLTTVVYLIAGVFLIYQYWMRLRRQVVLAAGVLFVLYSIYRFFLVRRAQRRSTLDGER